MILIKMTEERRADFISRLEEWLYTDEKEYNEGMKLFMECALEGVETRNFRNGDPGRWKPVLIATLKEVARLSGYPKLITSSEQQNRLYKAVVPVTKPGSHIPEVKETSEDLAKLPNFDRYAKFDTYKDRLSPALQQTGEQVKDWFLNLQSLHSRLKQLAGDEHTDEERAPVSQALIDQETQIREYFDDVEAYMKEAETNPNHYFIVPEGTQPSGKFTKEEIDRMEDPVFQAQCKMLRIDADTKYCKRTDSNNPERLALAIKELTEWGIEIPEKKDSKETADPL